MTTNTSPLAAAPAATPSSDPIAFDRIFSIDVFRGLTMILMIFVNDLSSVRGLPRWNYHAHANEDFMTYVDMVFPAFLFILGMALPLAIERRLKKDPSIARLSGYIVLRTVALLVLGLILANGGSGDPALMHGLNPNLLTLIALFGAVLFWAVYPRDSRNALLHRAMRFSGLALIVLMAIIFRRTTRSGQVAWIEWAYPEILGLIGFTYLCSSFLYLLTRRIAWAPLGWFLFWLTFCAASCAKLMAFPDHLSMWAFPFSNGAMVAISMAGVFTSSLFFGALRSKLASVRHVLIAAVTFGIVSLVAGYALRPLGISKIRATPTWCLWSIGASVLVFTFLYWLCDLRHHTRWAAFTRPAGFNTLLTYLVPDTVYFLLYLIGSNWLAQRFNFGVPGVLRAIVFTALMMCIAGLLTRARVRLQL